MFVSWAKIVICKSRILQTVLFKRRFNLESSLAQNIKSSILSPIRHPRLRFFKKCNELRFTTEKSLNKLIVFDSNRPDRLELCYIVSQNSRSDNIYSPLSDLKRFCSDQSWYFSRIRYYKKRTVRSLSDVFFIHNMFGFSNSTLLRINNHPKLFFRNHCSSH
jgi:hypothetical protein